MMRTLALVVSAVLLLPPTSTLAGPPEPSGVETRVRIRAPELSKKPLVGTLTAVEPDVVLLRVDGEDRPLTVPRDLVTKWEVSQGRHSHVGRDAAWGLLGGVVVGAALVTATYEEDSWFSQGESLALGAGFLGGIGAVLGALVGINKTESWEEVDQQSLRLGVTPVPRGIGVSLRWTFGNHRGPSPAERSQPPASSAAGPPAPSGRM
jgi:hypothetical protein